jgi:hypothetical protein
MKIERIASPHVAEPPPGRWSNALRCPRDNVIVRSWL